MLLAWHLALPGTLDLRLETPVETVRASCCVVDSSALLPAGVRKVNVSPCCVDASALLPAGVREDLLSEAMSASSFDTSCSKCPSRDWALEYSVVVIAAASSDGVLGGTLNFLLGDSRLDLAKLLLSVLDFLRLDGEDLADALEFLPETMDGSRWSDPALLPQGDKSSDFLSNLMGSEWDLAGTAKAKDESCCSDLDFFSNSMGSEPDLTGALSRLSFPS